MCDVTAAVVVGGMAVAGAASAAASKPKTPTSTTTTPTSAAQSGAQNYGLTNAGNLYDSAIGAPRYDGPITATQDPRVQQALDGGANFATGAGGDLADKAVASAGSLIGAAPGFVDRATTLATNGAGPANATSQGVLTSAAQGASMATGGVAGATGLSGQQGALSTAQGLVQQAGGPNPAQAALSTGGQFANDPVVQAQIDAAASDVTRNFSETTMPGLNAAASAGGNMNSARAGAAEAVARRGAEDRIAATAATIRGNAFNQGVGASLTGNEQNNSLALGANAQAGAISGALTNTGETQRQFDTNTQVGAAQALGQQDTANRALDANIKLDANAQTGQAALSGFDAAGAAGSLVDKNVGRVAGAGLNATGVAQQAIDEARAQSTAQYDYDKGILADYMGFANGIQPTGASTTVGTAPQAPSVIQGALGGAAAGMGISNAAGLNTSAVGATGALYPQQSVGANTGLLKSSTR